MAWASDYESLGFASNPKTGKSCAVGIRWSHELSRLVVESAEDVDNPFPDGPLPAWQKSEPRSEPRRAEDIAKQRVGV